MNRHNTLKTVGAKTVPGIIKRIINIARSKAGDLIDRYADQSVYGAKRAGKKYHEDEHYSSENGQNFSHDTSYERGSSGFSGYPPQIVEDLKTFGLQPPSSFDEVKKARNREIRKYHSDKFMHDPEKLETSKQIMQILNSAYERLDDWFNNRRS